MKNSILLLSNDLRIEDNTALINSLKNSDYVYIVYILNPNDIIVKKDKHKKLNMVLCLIESLNELNFELENLGSKLYFFYDNNILLTIKKIIKETNASSIYVNINQKKNDFFKYRNSSIITFTKKNNINFKSYEDNKIFSSDVKKSDDEPYISFKCYYKKSLDILNKNDSFYKSIIKKSGKKPSKKLLKKLASNNIVLSDETNLLNFSENILEIYKKERGNFNINRFLKGGTKNANKNLNEWNNFSNNAFLSPYIKFGCISISKIFNKLLDLDTDQDNKNKMIKEILLYKFFVMNSNILESRNKMIINKYVIDQKLFNYFTSGISGFISIDYLIRKMKYNGYLSDFERKILLSFFIKENAFNIYIISDLFERFIIDYDKRIFMGNAIYFLNKNSETIDIWKILENFDLKDVRILIPELKLVPDNHIKEWYNYYLEYPKIYPKPLSMPNSIEDIKKNAKLNLIKAKQKN